MVTLSKINKYLFEELYIIPLLILVASFNSFPLLKNLYLFFPLFGVVFLFVKKTEFLNILRDKKLTLVFYSFPLWAVGTSFWSLEPKTSLIRAIYVGFVLTVAVLAGTLWFRKRENLNFLIPVNVFVVIVSVISLVFGVPELSWNLDPIWRFKGFAQHQNTLGALILFTSLPLIWNLFFKRINIFQMFLFILNVGILVITFSRASIFSFLVVVVVLTIRFKFILFLKILASSIVLIGIVLFIKPEIVVNPINRIVFKGSDSVYSTREKLYNDSFKAAQNGGLIGLGYGVSDPTIENPINIGGSNSIREKGNSILALIEETGIVGLFLFFLPVLLIIENISLDEIFKNRELFSLITLYLSLLLHSQFEACLGGVSSLQLLVYFAFLAIVFQVSINKVKVISNE